MSLNIVRQPEEFKFGGDFDIYYERFKAYLVNVKCEQAAQYPLFLSYIDKESFRKVQGITFNDEHKTENKVDLEKAAAVLKEALSKPTKVPPKMVMRYRIQNKGESISDFGYAIQVLGHDAYGNEAETTEAVIESFSSGLSDPDLAAKMVQRTFTTLKAAIDYAAVRESNSNIRSFLLKNRTVHSDSKAAILECITEEIDVARVQSSAKGFNEPSANNLAGSSNRPESASINQRSQSNHNQSYQHQPGKYNQGYGHDHGQQQQNQSYWAPQKQGYQQHYGSQNQGFSNNWRPQNQGYGNWRPQYQNSPNYNGQRGQYKETRRCHYCHLVGHLQRFCYRKMKDEGRPRNGEQSSQYNNTSSSGRDFRPGPGQ